MPEHESRSHLRYRRTIEHPMPTGTKIAAIVLVVLLGAAGLYYAFVAPPASNTKPASARESGSSPTGTTANGLSSQTPSTLAPAVPSVGAQPSSASSTPAIGTLGAAGATNGQSPAAVTPVPTGLPAGTGATAPREQPGFAPGSLGAAGPGKGDLPASARPAPVAAPGATVNGIPVSGSPAPSGTAPTVGAVPASGTAPAPAAVGGPRPTSAGPVGTVPVSPAVGTPAGPTSPASAGPLGETTHTVASGETMSSIAKKYLGSENSWRTIAKANPTVDPTAMKIGTKLRIPSPESNADKTGATPASRTASPASAASGSTATAAGGEGTHVVASGDTLASIARKYFGNTKHWERIYSENRSVIGADPAALKVGQKLRIPAKSTVTAGEPSRR